MFLSFFFFLSKIKAEISRSTLSIFWQSRFCWHRWATASRYSASFLLCRIFKNCVRHRGVVWSVWKLLYSWHQDDFIVLVRGVAHRRCGYDVTKKRAGRSLPSVFLRKWSRGNFGGRWLRPVPLLMTTKARRGLESLFILFRRWHWIVIHAYFIDFNTILPLIVPYTSGAILRIRSKWAVPWELTGYYL